MSIIIFVVLYVIFASATLALPGSETPWIPLGGALVLGVMSLALGKWLERRKP